MSARTERRLIQIATGFACLVPLLAGGGGVLEGPGAIGGVEAPWPIDLDSHFRYLSGLLLGIGLTYAACIPTIERRSDIFRALGAVIVIGGLARLLSLVDVGVPGRGHRFGLVMELVVVPAITLWQARVAQLCGALPSPR